MSIKQTTTIALLGETISQTDTVRALYAVVRQLGDGQRFLPIRIAVQLVRIAQIVPMCRSNLYQRAILFVVCLIAVVFIANVKWSVVVVVV